MWDNTASATSMTDMSAMSSKVSLVLALVALHLWQGTDDVDKDLSHISCTIG